MNKPYTRESFNQLRLRAQKAERKSSVILATVSVILGMSALQFLKWSEKSFSGTNHQIISILTFLIYIGMVLWLLFRMKHISRKVALKCPQCEEQLAGETIRIASATGNCEKCGGKVILDE